jgi:hypothetical protein
MKGKYRDSIDLTGMPSSGWKGTVFVLVWAIAWIVAIYMFASGRW